MKKKRRVKKTISVSHDVNYSIKGMINRKIAVNFGKVEQRPQCKSHTSINLYAMHQKQASSAPGCQKQVNIALFKYN